MKGGVRVGNQLDDGGVDRNGSTTKVEQDVTRCHNSAKNAADDPGADRVDGHLLVGGRDLVRPVRYCFVQK